MIGTGGGYLVAINVRGGSSINQIRMEGLFPPTVISDWLLITFSPIITWRIDGETMETVTDFRFRGSKKMVTEAMKLKDVYSLEEKR